MLINVRSTALGQKSSGPVRHFDKCGRQSKKSLRAARNSRAAASIRTMQTVGQHTHTHVADRLKVPRLERKRPLISPALPQLLASLTAHRDSPSPSPSHPPFPGPHYSRSTAAVLVRTWLCGWVLFTQSALSPDAGALHRTRCRLQTQYKAEQGEQATTAATVGRHGHHGQVVAKVCIQFLKGVTPCHVIQVLYLTSTCIP
jgi:hypothetical protein